MADFKLKATFEPAGDQPAAISELEYNIFKSKKHQVLLGVTGSGKTFTIANLIQRVQKPTLIMTHNKTLAGQLYEEFREFFPENAVEYFVSYYDYYQPEAYIARKDVYIEKDCAINDRIERLRHSATNSLLTRNDVIVIASVSCIYGLGNPDEYNKLSLSLKVGDIIERDEIVEKLVEMQYERNDIELIQGKFRIRGECIDIIPSYSLNAIRIQMFDTEIETITEVDAVSFNTIKELDELRVYPASHYVSSKDKLIKACDEIEKELEDRLSYFSDKNKVVEFQRLNQRTKYDLELLKEMGSCKGIENYSRHFDGRKAGEPPFCLMNFFPDDYLLVIDESHMTIPQINGMYKGDNARKSSLIDNGFRLVSAFDNRPLKFNEFEKLVNQVVYLSATPADYELNKTKGKFVEQVVRPTGLLDPKIEVRKIDGQIDDLLIEINKRIELNERVLITTLTKKFSERLSDFLADAGIKARYLHSEIDTLERAEIIRDLRLKKFDVLVGINLLREGLDIPEVSLVAIIDADKEGFLRSARALIQTIGRCARNVNGKVIMYADKITRSMKIAIDETERRRRKQELYNKKHNITPKTIIKAVRNSLNLDNGVMEKLLKGAVKNNKKKKIEELYTEMIKAADNLDFEIAAALRDEIQKLGK